MSLAGGKDVQPPGHPASRSRPTHCRDFSALLEHPTHAVRLRRLPHSTSPHPVWQISPQPEPDAYTLTFGLPEQVESGIIDQDAGTHSRTRWVKQSMLSAMTVYWTSGDHAHTFQLPIRIRGVAQRSPLLTARSPQSCVCRRMPPAWVSTGDLQLS